MVLVAGAAWWWSSRSSSGEALLAKAYTAERPFDYRLPDAGYAPPRQSRGQESAFDRPRVLGDAIGAIGKRLAKHPQDKRELALKGRADLLEGNVEAALEALRQAAPGDQGDAEVLADLAAAYGLRGDLEKRPLDYGHAAELLLRALKMKPHDQRMEFNLALTYEKLQLVEEAIAAWRQFLHENPPPGWRQEGDEHLAALEKKRVSKKAADERVVRDAALFLNGYSSAAFDPLPWFEIFWIDWMPKAASDKERDRAAQVIAGGFARLGEYALIDSLRAPESRAKRDGLALLAEAMTANRGGRAGDALTPARASAAMLDRAGLHSAAALGRIELVYAAGWAGLEKECMETSEAALRSLGARNPWLRANASLEHSSCLQRAGQDGAARIEIQAALRQLAAAGLWPMEMRALQFRAAIDAYSGNYNSVWDTAVEGLRRYWNSQATPYRAQAYQVFLELAAEGTGWDQCAVVLYRAAANSAHAAGNLEIEAANHADLAKLLHRLGEYQAETVEWETTGRLLDRAGQGRDVQALRWETELRRVESEIATQTAKEPVPKLQRLNAEAADKSPADRLELEEALGTVLRARGDESGAAAAFQAAVNLDQKLAESEKSWVHRQPIVEMAASSYRNLTEIEFNAGESGEALKIWQEFRPAVTSTQRMITMALLPDGIAVWSGSAGRVRWMNGSAEQWQRLSEEFLALCASPSSSVADIRNLGNHLYRELAAPELRRLGPGIVHLRADGWLAQIPFAALTDDQGNYLAHDYEFVEAYGPAPKGPVLPITGATSAYVLVVPTGTLPGGLRLPVLAAAQREAAGVAARFPLAELARETTMDSIQTGAQRAQIFHFCGHGWANGGNGALVLPPGPNGELRFVTSRNLAEQNWSQCQLAVLSACLTATGEAREVVNSQSLVQAFLSAGARRVVAARWSIDSEATSQLMSGFYPRLVSGKSVPEALYGAAAAVAAVLRWSHPYYWAGFDVFGSA
jgi:tetratricopeptide (TPR) repeat protein